jgi:hypothetical protein
MRERMLAGEPYVFDESLAEDTRRCRVLLQRINSATPDQDAERDAALAELLGSFGEHSNIRPPFRCACGYQIHVGDRVFAKTGWSASASLGSPSAAPGSAGVQHHPTHPCWSRRGFGRAPADHDRPACGSAVPSWSARESRSAMTPSARAPWSPATAAGYRRRQPGQVVRRGASQRDDSA